jgi:ATP-dependent helicase HrpB
LTLIKSKINLPAEPIKATFPAFLMPEMNPSIPPLNSPAPPELPVLAVREKFVEALRRVGQVVLAAPPGTGKSTQAPKFALELPGEVWVLQPRRVAARSLAHRVARELGEPLGKTVGYQVRFESQSGPTTRIHFLTYGIFRQRLLRNPYLPEVGTVLLDEFHERSLEADLALAHMRRLRSLGKGPTFAVMSATLEGEVLRNYLPDAVWLEVQSPLHPVTLRHQDPRSGEGPHQQAARAFTALQREGFSGSVLVFMPGTGEIRRTLEALDPLCRQAGYTLHALQGNQTAAEQQAALEAPSRGLAVVVSTNVAETSLTIPGIQAVIDSGLHRLAYYDASRDLNVLSLQPITAQNAVQRAGRAGRLGPGLCIRLWPEMRERSWSQAVEPEIARVDLAEACLVQRACSEIVIGPTWQWPTPPPPQPWARAEARLTELGAFQGSGLSERGRELLRYPVPPHAGAISRSAGDVRRRPQRLHRQVLLQGARPRR